MVASTFYFFFRESKWGVNFFLWPLTFLVSKEKMETLEDMFCCKFKKKMVVHQRAMEAFYLHLNDGAQIYLISGSPEKLINKIYTKLLEDRNVFLIGSEIKMKKGAFVVTERCVRKNKLKFAIKAIGENISFSHGYTDSLLDLPILIKCVHKNIVLPDGTIKQYIQGE